tara:strand:- start:2475 stop:2588 length:114 start_codon:yes stop_codon:yes gene_type:complete
MIENSLKIKDRKLREKFLKKYFWCIRVNNAWNRRESS